ncbi:MULTISPECIES: helix-turn-helix domain-containing protein [Xanthobacter]|uniref:Transcriptional regulator n=1 Tax=Xanthobacter flavus TaxID=281 RepID=A0A9W6CIH8_XANFL|nr:MULTISPECIES: helix-turn-helix domain-containing protein [Xanthobacter]MDR6333512.1 CRP/FNR family nitrogen fixation transcriptional regulator [Xanthobacter flavus]NMN59248.1 CRP/FNR family nitrogen fixation transcriptional regulator [Xanthobacter sp. SG618]UDQ90614.1 helix-turn-helix domain-containing protein [Xanthobacter autotrophicus]UJX47555.1 transcriptional regulator [Xanthobacter sp. YC-JY1]GLI20736.1 transcriptional regulator [Xanthobacter flavus]
MPSPAAAIAHKTYAQPRAYDSKSFAEPLSSARPAHRWTEEADTRTPTEVVARLGVVASYARNAEIFGEDQPAENLYIVLSGAVRICKLLGDGRRQIETFCLPGDVFGWEMTGRHRFSAEAVSECKIVRVKRSILFSRASDDAELAHALWALTAAELGRAQDHLLVLGRKTAQERVATFLLDMAERAGAGQGPNGVEVTLPMSRQDIADFLGLTIETVSRTLTHLEEISAIALPSSRRVVLRDGATLKRLNS